MKQKTLKKTYSNFNIKKITTYTQKDINHLLKDKRIIHNKLKINTAIHNTQKILEIKKKYKTFIK